jgi:GABA(A) receptor-associated protein
MDSFKHKYRFEDRVCESSRILTTYPDRVPIICEKSKKNNNNLLPVINKNKYLVPIDLTMGQFMYVIRQRMKLNSEEGIFLFVGNNIVSSSSIIGNIYQTYKDSDGFLYIQYSKENVFGSF